MEKVHIQFAGLVALFVLALALVALIAYTTHTAVGHVTTDGKVPLLDAGQVTAYLLAFQQVVNTMKSIWDSQERSTLSEGLLNSTPASKGPPPPASAREAAGQVADAAQERSDEISGREPSP